MDLQLSGKKALVLGGSSGIGLAIAKSLKQENCLVYLASRNEKKLSSACKEIQADGYFTFDSEISGQTELMCKKALREAGHFDILVCNTGGPKKNIFSQVTTDQWKNDFESLWMSPVEAIKSLVPEMINNKFGRVFFVTSIAAIEPLAGLTTSNGLRAGLEGLCKSLSLEYAKVPITFNVLRPGYTDTERLKELNLSPNQVSAMVPMGRLGKPSELADLLCFLASPKAEYITGQNISIDGGATRSH